MDSGNAVAAPGDRCRHCGMQGEAMDDRQRSRDNRRDHVGDRAAVLSDWRAIPVVLQLAGGVDLGQLLAWNLDGFFIATYD